MRMACARSGLMRTDRFLGMGADRRCARLDATQLCQHLYMRYLSAKPDSRPSQIR